MVKKDKPVVLSVEDNAADARLIREIFKDSRFSFELRFVLDGAEAMDFLLKRNQHEGAPTPDLILLDLNLPKLDGREVLKAVKSDASLRRIPVLIFTSSSAEEDVRGCYDLHANSYITKPAELDQFSSTIKAIEEFWFVAAVLPYSNNFRSCYTA